jgi:hypothetical protein
MHAEAGTREELNEPRGRTKTPISVRIIVDQKSGKVSDRTTVSKFVHDWYRLSLPQAKVMNPETTFT